MDQTKQAYKAMKRICLNNWHYIDQKVLTLSEGINFFTGHSGSGKSTVIDALQIILYANTDGRSFFNKAAADDSDRSLIEYLRGMINIGENNQAEYKRNHNFSTTIVLELEQTITGEKECVGVIFDVETSTNEVNKMFFWHKGEMLPGDYRREGRAMAISELKTYLARGFEKDSYLMTGSNERFRRNLYDVYLGGLDMEKFPRLFKRAIPFRMNIKLEDFVKEYICMEQDIHIEEMQESVVLYGRMRRKIEEARKEIAELTEIEQQYQKYQDSICKKDDLNYRMERLSILQIEQLLHEIRERVEAEKQDLVKQQESRVHLEEVKESFAKEYDEINRQIIGSGYAKLEEKLQNVETLIHQYERGEKRFQVIHEHLRTWEEEEIATNQMIWDIEKFQTGEMTGEDIERLKKSLKEIQSEVEKQRQEAASEARSYRKEANLIEGELNEIRLGKKAYPRELEDARREIQRKVSDKTGKNVAVRILADLLDIRDEKWRNAIEGYLGNHKLALMVEPKYVKEAMEVYETLDSKKYWRVSLVDTEKLVKTEHAVKEHALAEEIEARESYVESFVSFLLGNVMKCDSVEELRQCKIGVTADCMLYQNYQLRRLNPDNYTRWAFIGEKSMRKRQQELQARFDELSSQMHMYEEAAEDAKRILDHEFLSESVESYMDLMRDISAKEKAEEEKAALERKMQQIGADTVDLLKQELQKVKEKQKEIDQQLDNLKIQIHDKENSIRRQNQLHIDKNTELVEKQNQLRGSKIQEDTFAAYMEEQKLPNYETLIKKTHTQMMRAIEKSDQEKDVLVDIRSAYLKIHPNREFSASTDTNEKYAALLKELQCDQIKEYEEKAGEQAKVAVEHFREDFIYKIRSAIKEAYIRRDELNRIIRNLNFGKDRYQFKITKNKGLDGEYYDMFMDEALEIDPSSLSENMEHQVNMFGMEHETKYGTRMNDLIHIFIPKETANAKEQEEAKKNMEKYADYRTYLSFEMEQIVEGEERLVIGLSKMIKKNSGGEGQNPLYVALLASFAQAYHISTSPKLSRRPGIRLVVLDEAFSKMDAEKVASCIELIRGLGFQAIISATNDKIQNYLENVDKTFVYANPNKKSISIQEFEKKDFGQLEMEEDEIQDA